MKKVKFYVVVTPTGDRPYVSLNLPQSYVDHLDASGERAEVHEVEVPLAKEQGDCVTGSCSGVALFCSTRVR